MCPDEELRSVGVVEIPPLSLRNELAALGVLKDAANMSLAAFPHSLEVRHPSYPLFIREFPDA